MSRVPTRTEMLQELQNDSLMDEIQKIIKPPDEDTKSGVKKSSSTYRKIGTRHNNDYCYACQETGVLICCDECPASFHYQCHDPPLSPEKLPEEFICNACRMAKKLNPQKVKSNTSSVSEKSGESSNSGSRPQTPNPDGNDKNIRITRIRASSRKSSSGSSEGSDKNKPSTSGLGKISEEAADEKEETPKEPPKMLTPLEELIRAASLLNPRQFELPRELNQTFQFPGCERAEVIRNGKKIGKTRKPYEKDPQGLVPIPAKLCFVCQKSCKNAPLVACDYCTLLFHQDCLDPPLTALPAGLWMCPNHPEQFIDWHLLQSSSSTERVKLWNKFNSNVDHETVKLQFFRRIHNRNPPFRVKSKMKPKNKIEVPEIVEYHYKNPPCLLPSYRDILRFENLRKRGTVPIDFYKKTLDEEVDAELTAMENAKKKLKTMAADISNIQELFEDDDEDEEMKEDEKKEEDKPEIKQEVDKDENPAKDSGECSKNLPKPEEVKPANPEKADIEIKDEGVEIVSSDQPTETINLICDEAMEPENSSNTPSKATDEESAAIESELKNLDMKTIKLLAYQRLQQILNDHPDYVKNYQDKKVASKTVTDLARREFPKKSISLPSQLLTKEDIEKITRSLSSSECVDPDLHNQKKIEAHRHYDLRQKPFSQRSDEEKAQTIALSLEKPISQSKVRARAVFTPVNNYLSGEVWFTSAPNLEKSVRMRYRSFQVGTGPGCDLNLNSFGTCAFVSPKHATIFFDEITKNFELLNYSEFGTEVNGQLFTCDFTEFQNQFSESPSSQTKEKRVAIQSKIKNMIDAKKKIRENMENVKSNDVVMAAPEPPVCHCQGRSPMIAGWEGTALLQHGFLIKFGCLSFVFSITDYDSGNED